MSIFQRNNIFRSQIKEFLMNDIRKVGSKIKIIFDHNLKCENKYLWGPDG